jgi:hypothetical protein
MRLDSSGNVGIGETSPQGTLHVKSGDSTGTASSAGDELVVEHSASNGGISILAPNTATSYLLFGDSDNNDVGAIGYAHSTNNLTFTTNASEAMRINSSGQVGIGTTSPNSYANYRVLTLQGTNGAEIDFENSSGTVIGAIYNSATDLFIASDFTNAVASSNIVFTCDGSERMRIDSSGNAGIGTDSPESLLHIEGNAAPSIITLGRSASNTAGNVLGALQFKNTDGSNDGPNMVANIQAVVPNANGSGGYLKFGTHDGSEGGEGSSPVDRMIIDQDGNVLVGTTSQSVNTTNFGTRISSSTPGYLASYRDVSGTAVAVLFGGNAGQVYVRGDGDLENTNNNYGAISDERLKSDIVDASSQIDDIMAVQVRSYTLNETGATHIGVVAQELEASGMSGLVKTDDEGMKSVKYSILYMKAIKALQEAVTRIETLEAEVTALKGE